MDKAPQKKLFGCPQLLFWSWGGGRADFIFCVSIFDFLIFLKFFLKIIFVPLKKKKKIIGIVKHLNKQSL